MSYAHPTLQTLVEHTKTACAKQGYDNVRIVTPEELRQHASGDESGNGDYWIGLCGYVYDVKPFFVKKRGGKKHPAGNRILLKFLGQDATDTFQNFHYPKGKAVVWAPEMLVGILGTPQQAPRKKAIPAVPTFSQRDDDDDEEEETVEVKSPKKCEPNQQYPITVTLAEVVQESSPLVKTFRWTAERNVFFLPGQYVTFEFDNIPNSTTAEIRSWTLTNTPPKQYLQRGDKTLCITVKRSRATDSGLSLSNWLHNHASVGLQAKLKFVGGEMTALQPDSSPNRKVRVPKHLLLVSGGIGITPNLAMVRGIHQLQLQSNTNITMIHAERNSEELIAQSELQQYTQAKQFVLHNIITSQQGRLSQDKLGQLLLDQAASDLLGLQEAYVCGPDSFMEDVVKHLELLGVPSSQIHTESFDS